MTTIGKQLVTSFARIFEVSLLPILSDQWFPNMTFTEINRALPKRCFQKVPNQLKSVKPYVT